MRADLSDEKYQGGNVNKTYIVVKLQFEGIHCWPRAEGKINFLGNQHRHVFHVTVKKQVSNLDREIEIITLKRKILSRYGQVPTGICDFGSDSCETVASTILQEFDLDYVQVLEDGENGAEVYK